MFSLKCRLSRSSASAAGPGVPGPLVMTALRFWIAAEERRPYEGEAGRELCIQIEFRDRRDDLVQAQDRLLAGLDQPVGFDRLHLNPLEIEDRGLRLRPLDAVDGEERHRPSYYAHHRHLVQRLLDDLDVVGKITCELALTDRFGDRDRPGRARGQGRRRDAGPHSRHHQKTTHYHPPAGSASNPVANQLVYLPHPYGSSYYRQGLVAFPSSSPVKSLMGSLPHLPCPCSVPSKSGVDRCRGQTLFLVSRRG